MKPNPGKSKEAQQVLKKMSEHWKRHGAVEAFGSMLFGAEYSHLSFHVRLKTLSIMGNATIP